MNREIKFRAWHKEEKKLCVVNIITNEGAFLIGVNKGKDIIVDRSIYYAPDDGRFCKSNEIELMQFTGVKDKNGKEIFELDVVRRVAKKYDFEKFYKNEISSAHYDEIQISFIEYRENGFWVKDEDFGYEGEDMWDWEEMEVIGNVFENTELIKKDNNE